MKVLVYVSGVDSVPDAKRQGMQVVNANNWRDVVQLASSSDRELVMFLMPSCPAERLLKLVEDYPGDVVCYSSVELDPILHSRFTHLLNRRPVRPSREAFQPSPLEDSLRRLKACL